MCGICGKLSWEDPPSKTIVEKMTRKIAHRGPDGEEVKVIDDSLIMGFRRLAIIDLSAAGDQPMKDTSGKYWIVFNGEIYNYLDLREELARSNTQFKSNSDTEVILESYKRWGIDCVNRFNGMFAFALWDGPKNRLMLARDRLGKKPFYYYVFPDGGISFASELKSLLEDTEIKRELNPAALNHYLSLNYTLTSEAMIKGVKKLPAAHVMTFERRKSPRIHRYWDLTPSFSNKRTFSTMTDATEELKGLIDDSVRLRLISDVPLGAFLSGGIDSSSIVASMSRQVGPENVHSFSVGFKEKGYSELEEARSVASFLGINHHDKVVSQENANLLPATVFHADEPFADTSMIPTYLLSEFSRQYVAVCLSGDGGDEIFAGYETYRADRIHNMTRWLPNWLTTSLYRAVDNFWPVSHAKVSFDYKIRKFLEGHQHESQKAHFYWRDIFSNEEKKSLLSGDRRDSLDSDPYSYFDKFNKEVEDLHYLDKAMYVDINTWLVDDILVKVDRASMAHGLEARSPLLDYRIVEFAASLPVSLRMKGLENKFIFKKSQGGLLPKHSINRAKQGFNSPVSHWADKKWREKYYDLSIGNEGPVPFEKSFVKNLWDEHFNKRKDHSLKLLGLINFQLWCKEFEIV